MFHDENGVEFDPVQEERVAAELEDEREQVLELQIRHDERLRLRPLEIEEIPGRKKLKRELRREALTRLEEAARSQRDFEEVVAWWNKLDENRERRERDHEISRGDVPLEYGMSRESLIFPAYRCGPYWQELHSGYFLNLIFDCPYEMHELLINSFLSKLVFDLKEDHKELLYYKAIRRYSSTALGAVLGQTARNIRKKWARLTKRIQKRLFGYLAQRSKKGRSLTLREADFLERYGTSALDDGKDEW